MLHNNVLLLSLFVGFATVGPAAVLAAHELLSSKDCNATGVVCHGLPSGCVKSAPDSPCEVLARISTKGDVIHVELNANANQSQLHLNLTNRWIALGFSNVKKKKILI